MSMDNFPEGVTPEQVTNAIEAAMPSIRDRFRRLGHREIRVNLFVESMDPLAPNHLKDTPVVMVTLYLDRLL